MEEHPAVIALRQVADYCFQESDKHFKKQLAKYKEKIDSLWPPVLKPVKWEAVDFLPPNMDPTQNGVNNNIRFCGRVKRMSKPYLPMEAMDVDEYILDLEITSGDKSGIQCVPVLANRFDGILRRSLETGELVEFRGFVTNIPRKRNKTWILEPWFHLHDAVNVEETLQLLQASEEEISDAKEQLDGIPNRLKFIREELVRRLGISGSTQHPELMLALDASILQALAVGNVNKNAGRVHTLIIGSPGTGKSMLASAAKLLNPVSKEAQSSKCTVAGIQSAAHSTQDGFVSEPGLIPLADQGVFIIQDFHGVKDKASVLQVLSHVMEEGVLIDASAAKTKQQARTAIHLDLNRQSDLDPSHTAGSDLQDISMKLHILSRFDFIIEINRDPDRQKAVQRDMLGRNIIVNAGSLLANLDQQDRGRDLRLLVAVLRDENEAVLLTKGDFNNLVHDKIAALVQSIEHPILSDFISRQTISAFKLISAHARLQGRNVAIEEDLTAILPIMKAKVDFIKGLAVGLDKDATATDFTTVASRRTWIQNTFGGKVITAQEVVDALFAAGYRQAKLRATYRDLKKLGALKEEHGKWRL